MNYLLPFFLGLCAVAQAGLNRQIATKWGLSWAVIASTAVLLLVACIALAFGHWSGRPSLSSFRWWYLLPGFLGYAFVAGLPLSFEKIGALSSFMLIIAAQIIFSAIWDQLFEAMPISWNRFIGGAIVLFGAWFSSR